MTVNKSEWQYLRKRMQERGLAVQDVADYLDISPYTVYSWLDGGTSPTTARFIKLAELLGCRLERLIYSCTRLMEES